MRPHEVRRLRIRPGPGPDGPARARRLTDVAHRLLGRELDRALADVLPVTERRVELPAVRVRIELDPRDLDDEALAVVWAGLVRREVVRLLAGQGRLAAGVDVPEAPAGWSPSAPPALPDPSAVPPAGVAVAELADLLRVLSAAARAPSPADLRGLRLRTGDEAVVVEAVARLAPRERAPALALLAHTGLDVARLASLPHVDPASPLAQGPATGDTPRPGAAPAAATAGQDSSAQGATVEPGGTHPEPGAHPALSSYGGLVLLHHRLRGLLEGAVAAQPDADPVAARLDLLVAVAQERPRPDDVRPARDDPLLRLLAGDPRWSEPDGHPATGVAPEREAAEAVLRRLAGDLPGFAASTPDFVREQWLRRRALVASERDAVLLRLERRPLDLVLDALPYPIGALRLPWTPTLLVGWEAP
ncbi:hypothetical protein LRP67_19935 [Nocardioides sp. cx-169]|uniref:contractile injection system tape measure protein n=1 Tax=Nocardioides sp. cx-169 TaxID=2899080 RepID=UPI001E2CC335|nr:contractile injection system tape measure protein [Nocardioides sp. cx-169]MCD4536369.1 hypothetical protein [Nocardioides sp. cx-169]